MNRHELKNYHNVVCPETGLYRTFGPGIILQKDNCQNALDDHLSGQEMGESGGKLHPFPQEKKEWRTSFHWKRVMSGEYSRSVTIYTIHMSMEVTEPPDDHLNRNSK